MMPEDMPEESTEQFLSGGGEMGKLIRTMDWSKTALGPISGWPQSLRTSVSLCLSSTFPILIAWGEETIQIYNDSYRPICGAKHPQSMGQNFRICWETALPVVGDKFTRGQQGEGTYITDQRMFLDRYGYLEEAFMTFSFAPIRDESGGVGGIFHPISESTEKMLSGRRTKVLRDLGAAMGKAKSISEIGEVSSAQYSAFELDIPFLLFYQLDGESCKLVEAVGVAGGSPLAPLTFTVSGSPYSFWTLEQGQEMAEIANLDVFGQFHCGPYEESPLSAVVLPVRISGQGELFGFVVAGVSARRALDEDYLNFYGQLAATYNIAVSAVYAYEQEQKRAEALAEIDRSKTAFFSNVSHEFRTPLTLMLGPLEELLSRDGLSGSDRAHVEASHRNALRLLKLVNNLLDYSRVEAGRLQAVYRPVDLAELTIDLASSFRSIIEKAGMELLVNCGKLGGKYYLDQQMWEKIVLNLLSNAFKYTLEGRISVSLATEGGFAVLRVGDTGVGIPEKELPHMFERFHRVENAAGRTHEGTGIGLSLVHELVGLHGGEIVVDSMEGEGSVFTVRIPEGWAHLPQNLVSESGGDSLTSAVKGAFIKEAASLLEESDPGSELVGALEGGRYASELGVQVLVVDDNADMRGYLKRILSPYYTVRTATDGRDALEQVGALMPDLVLSDVMMQVMDGKKMLAVLRGSPATLRLPVIFLSARAGEEARIDGLESGADDYLVKPFSAAELLTKIRAQIHISRTRNFAEQQLRRLVVQAPVAMATYRGADHVIEIANARMLSYWGRNQAQVLGLPALVAIPELQEQGFGKVMDQVYLTGETFVSGEIGVAFEREGLPEVVYVNLMVEPLRRENGEIDGLIAVAADVTEQVQSRRELERTSGQLGIAIKAARMGIWRSELATGKLELSERARVIHGIPQDLIISYSQALTGLVDPAHIKRVSAAIDTAVAGSGRFDIDYRILPMDGTDAKWINTTGLVELDGSGRPVSVVGTLMDITEGKEDEIRKNDFIGMVSHELKTPLTSLTGFTQLGLRKSEKLGIAELGSLFEKSFSQVRKMSAMITGFLNISQLESGKFVLNVGCFSLKGLVLETIEDIRAASPNAKFEVSGDEVQLAADRDKLYTVLSNLLGNAVKYSKNSGAIEVFCTILGEMVRVEVRDHGPGIAASEIGRLFDRFYRVENAQTQHIAGFGIGLYLSAEIIRRHQGRIWAESELGKGASFFFELSLIQA